MKPLLSGFAGFDTRLTAVSQIDDGNGGDSLIRFLLNIDVRALKRPGNMSELNAFLRAQLAHDGAVEQCFYVCVSAGATESRSVNLCFGANGVPFAPKMRNSAFDAGGLFEFTFQAVRADLELSCRRLTDCQWLSPSGEWQGAQVAMGRLRDNRLRFRGHCGYELISRGAGCFSLVDWTFDRAPE